MQAIKSLRIDDLNKEFSASSDRVDDRWDDRDSGDDHRETFTEPIFFVFWRKNHDIIVFFFTQKS